MTIDVPELVWYCAKCRDRVPKNANGASADPVTGSPIPSTAKLTALQIAIDGASHFRRARRGMRKVDRAEVGFGSQGELILIAPIGQCEIVLDQCLRRSQKGSPASALSLAHLTSPSIPPPAAGFHFRSVRVVRDDR